MSDNGALNQDEIGAFLAGVAGKPGFIVSEAPSGLRSRNVWELDRVVEICTAIIGYKKTCYPIPAGWIDELRELTEKSP